MSLHHEPLRSSLWRAGAGAGKTYNLVERVIRIAEEWSRTHSGELPRLVVTTFTRMATQELRVRLMRRVLELLELYSEGPEGSDREFVKKLIPFVSSRSQLSVTTMHGVMEAYLRTFAREAGLDPVFRVAQADERASILRRVAHGVLKSGAADVLLSNFGFRRSMDVLHRLAQIKTEFGDARLATEADFVGYWLADLAACREPIRQTQCEIKDAGNSKWDPTLEWLDQLLAELNGIDASSHSDLAPDVFYQRVDSIERLLESRPAMSNRTNPKVAFSRKIWTDVFKNLARAIELIREERRRLPMLQALGAEALGLVDCYWAQLTEEKRRSGLIELEDLELYALRLIQDRPETAKTFAESWDHWLIDEYQDTSPRQVRLLDALSQSRGAFVVGDPQQSIYLFRGARPTVFQNREESALRSQHSRERLMTNRRSDPAVMDFINLAVTELGPEFEPMEAHRLADSCRPSPFGRVAYLQIPFSADESASARRDRESGEIAKAVRALIADRVRPAHIAVLGRKNQDLMQIGRAFDRLRIPYQVHTSGAFADRQETTDLVSILSFIVNPHDDASFIRFARAPWFPLSEDILALGYRRRTSLWTCLDSKLGLELEAHRNLLQVSRERGVVEAFKSALVSCDFFSFCGALDPSGRREANALKFLTRLVIAERQAGFNPKRFVDEILESGSDGGTERDAAAAQKPDRVSIMTIHASKGLEFDHVFIPFMSFGKRERAYRGDVVFHEEDRRFSFAVRDDEDGGISTGAVGRAWMRRLCQWEREEDKRVLYVAMTRARESLFFSSSDKIDESGFANLFKQSLASPTVARWTEVPLNLPNLSNLRLDHEVDSSRSEAPESTVRQPYGSGTARLERLIRGTVSVSRLVEQAFSAKRGVDPVTTPMTTPVAGTNDPERDLRMARKAVNGTRLHRVFELAQTIHENPDAMAEEIARWFPEGERPAAREALRWLLALASPNVSEVLANGEAEWSFVYRPENHPELAVEGQIDLWGRDRSGKLWVIDYKTGASEYREKAMLQLRYYAEALRKAGIAQTNETIALAAIYPFSREVFIETRERGSPVVR